MPPFDKIVQNAVEKLYEDERLRSNLTDSEAKIVLDWATTWITDQVNAARDEASASQVAQNEFARVRQTAAALNALAAGNATPRLADVIAALEQSIQPQQTLTREQVLSLATTLASALWAPRVRASGKA
ncbi:MAG: hypothetical protein KGJ80_03350 [Chloroflexota bacterium]|nr:hypothetical protein [Chloroflexota bacterium]